MVFLFYLLSLLAVFSALMVVLSKSPINSVIYLIITFLTIAGHYVLLNAQFLAVVHIIVYAGAIMVLFLFVIMLLNLNSQNEPQKTQFTKIAAAVSAGLFFLVMVGAAKGVATTPALHSFDGNIGLVKNLGQVLFKDFLLPFEVSSILFLSAMVGAILLSKKDLKNYQDK